jgi:hypothetical protein
MQPASGGIHQGQTVSVSDSLRDAARRRGRLGGGYQVSLHCLCTTDACPGMGIYSCPCDFQLVVTIQRRIQEQLALAAAYAGLTSLRIDYVYDRPVDLASSRYFLQLAYNNNLI